MCGSGLTNLLWPTVVISSMYGVLSHKFFFNPFPNNKFLYSSKLKEFADDSFKFDENGRKLSKWIENTVEKG